MNKLTRICGSLLWLGLVLRLAAGEGRAPQFGEVYDLLRSNLAGMDESALNRAAVDGLLKQLGPRVTLLTGSDATSAVGLPGAPELVKARVLDEAFGYFRIREVSAGLGKQFFEAYQEVNAHRGLKGLILDLRFAGGQDYAAARATADWFFSREQPLIDWGEGLKASTAKEEAIRVPVIVLVNAKTAAAAEALAGILRQWEVGLLLGAPTAGQASQFKEFPLRNGERLRLATSPVKVGNGEALPLTGLKPDLRVEVSPEEEQAYWEDAYKVVTKESRPAGASGTGTNVANVAGTNRASRPTNEAELVRLHREGGGPDADSTNTVRRPSEPAKPVLQDPALRRALDVLKGLAIVQPLRPRST